MITIVVKIILLAFAALFNSIMDKCETVISFNSSVFKKFNPSFWCKAISANKPLLKFTHYRVDAWHLSKSMMVICVCAAMSDNVYQFVILGIVWNVIFNTLYKAL